MQRRLFQLMIVTMVAVFSGCAGGPPAAGRSGTATGLTRGAAQQIIAVIPAELDSPFSRELRAGAERAAADAGASLIWTPPVGRSVDEQSAMIDELVQLPVTAIIIEPADPTALNRAIDRAVAAGVSVVTVVRDAPGSRRRLFVGVTEYQLGREAGAQFSHHVEGMPSPVDVVVLVVALDDPVSSERLRGIRSALEGTNVRIARVVEGGEGPEIASAAVERYLVVDPGVDGWILVSPWALMATTPVTTAFQELRDRGGFVVGMETWYPLLDRIDDGSVDTLVGRDYAAIATAAVEAIAGGATTTAVPSAGREIINRANLAARRVEKQPWR